MTLIDRFMAKVRVNARTGCHEWTGAKNAKGYGRFGLDGRNRHAHIVAWGMAFGPVPNGLFVCHHCDNPACVNPAHLFVGTNSDNMRDMIAKGRHRQPRGEAHSKAKLQPKDVLTIRSSPLTNTELARHYGVTRKAVAFIREGVNWRHI